MGLIVCPETSVRNYHSRLRNVAEERDSHLHRSETPEIGHSLFLPRNIRIFAFSDTSIMQQLRRQHQSCYKSPFWNDVSQDYLFNITKDGAFVDLHPVVS